jgi:uncharacterized membrane protein YvbJ
MHCPSCGFDTQEEMKFCNECGAPLRNRCPQCGFENPLRSKFCGECGTALTGTKRKRRIGESEKRGESKAERKKANSFGLRTSDSGLRTDFG